MKLKKIISLALAMIMAMALTVPALGADTDTTQNADMTGGTSVGTVSLTVTSLANCVFNPAKIYVKIGSTGSVDSSASSAAVNDQIIAQTVSIKNKTNVPLDMTATVGIDIKDVSNGTKAAVATAVPADNQTAKQIMLTADFAVFDSATETDIRSDSWITASKLVATAATRGNDGLTGGKTHAPKDVVKIPASGGTDETANYIYVKFGGAATKAPTTPWTTEDKFDIVTSFKFLPQTTPEKSALLMTAPVASNAYAAISSNTPTVWVPYQKNAVSIGTPQQSGAEDKNIFKNADTDAKIVSTLQNVWPNYTVTIKPVADSSNAGKYFAITAVTFRNEDGTNSNLKATKVGNKSDAYWTFTMPEANIQAIVTVASTSS